MRLNIINGVITIFTDCRRRGTRRTAFSVMMVTPSVICLIARMPE